jgi:hypothetical protein
MQIKVQHDMLVSQTSRCSSNEVRISNTKLRLPRAFLCQRVAVVRK